jgi:YidC/Oxa1 family membrane protein insertase
MNNNRNLFLTIGLSVLILTLWQIFYINPKVEAQREAARVQAERTAQTQTGTETGMAASGNMSGAEKIGQSGGDGSEIATTPVPDASPAAGVPGSETAAAEDKRIAIETDLLEGTINLNGARLDDLRLKKYHTTVDKNSPTIELLKPSKDKDGYFAELGYAANGDVGGVPGPDTMWTAGSDAALTQNSPVVLTYTNEKGIVFQRTISVDDGYMFNISDKVINNSGQPAILSPYGRVARFEKPDDRSTYVLHEGLIGVTGEEGLQEIKYSKIESEKSVKPGKSKDGWLGITDKYWAVALIPSPGREFQPRFSYFDTDRTRYQSDYLEDPITVNAGGDMINETRIFAGAKVVSRVQNYEKKYNIRQFDLLIDWGWFYFITKPMFYLIDWLYKFTGNFGIAILITTVLVKTVFFPLANKSYASMAKMKLVQPRMMEIREQFADDKVKQQQAMMELYKKEKINPLAGCWPMLIQIPVFFALYKVLYVTIEMRHAPFFGWIQDLAAPDPTSIVNLFGLLPFDSPGGFLHLGVWPLIMGITMFVQMRMNPPPPDPTQAMIFNWMPLVFMFMLASFPAGLVIYWAWNNTLTIIQQGLIMKRQGVKIELWDNLKSLFRKKPTPAE